MRSASATLGPSCGELLARRGRVVLQVLGGRLEPVVLRLQCGVLGLELGIVLLQPADARAERRQLLHDLVERRFLLGKCRRRDEQPRGRQGSRTFSRAILRVVGSVARRAASRPGLWRPTMTLLLQAAARASARRTGKCAVKVEPCPSSLAISSRPPWRCNACLTIERPSPEPPLARARARSTR